jgi:hypothetical protein
MGRNTIADSTPLLKDAEQNIGNSDTVLPQPGSSGTVIPQSNPLRIVNLRGGGSAAGQTTSVIMVASRILRGATNPNPGLPGPITGVVEFGNGGQATRAEFDVPVGPFVGDFNQAASALEPQDGGTIITVPTGVLRVFARYDNLLISPVLNTTPPVSLAQLLGVPFLGPGGPSGAPVPIPPEPLLVRSMAAYFTRSRSKAYKTNYLYVANLSAPTAINLNTRRYFCLPAFAKTVKVLRTPVSAALDIVLSDGIHTVDQIAVAGGTTCPEIDLVGQERIIGLQSPLLADNYIMLALACEVGI